jgi:hypothetical protein
MHARQPGTDDRFRDPRTHLYALAMTDIIVVSAPSRRGRAALARRLDHF